MDDAPPLILNFFDTDVGIFDSEDDYMGRAVIFLKDINELSNDDTIPTPEWYPVKYSMDDPWDFESGAAILCSFACVDYDYDFAVEAKDIALDTQVMIPSNPPKRLDMPNLLIESYNIVINVLGLRGLVSTGLLPVKKPFVKFSVKSLLPSEQAKAVQDIYTIPDEGGSDPNIRTTLKFTVNISSDPHYCPQMTCTVYDKLYFDGMRQPILGVFTLKLGDILKLSR